MKELSELKLPDDRKYSDDHEWVKMEGDLAIVGISDFAQDQLGDIVFVEMPEVGDSFDRGDDFGSLESVKAVSELFMPVGGEVVEINEALEDAPELLNDDPHTNWIVKVKPADASEYEKLLGAGEYLEKLKG